ncbi:MAG: DUF1320 domain-containing protein [Mediterranea sp.]|jgi:phage gp36-like protein|nr:DUF1320 domain-containing protein [Mediterranea sp.]
MAFITQEDYIQVGGDALTILQQNSAEKRALAERRALARIADALRGRYDIDSTFAAEGEDRDEVLVGYAIDMALYYLVGAMPGKMGLEVRRERYKEALEYLRDIQDGKVMPDIPTITGPNGEEDYHNPIRYGSMKKNNYDW